MLYDAGITDKTCTYIYDFYEVYLWWPSTDYQIKDIGDFNCNNNLRI